MLKKLFNKKEMLQDLVVDIISMTISIIITFGTASVAERIQRNKARKLTAIMVLSSIESFCRNMEDQLDDLARKDTLATWLLHIPADSIPLMDEQELLTTINEVQRLTVLMHDKTSETIFSNNIGTWENVGNFSFIDQVGQCFYGINWITDRWQQEVHDIASHFDRIQEHPSEYPGETFFQKYLTDMQVRGSLTNIHSMRNWFERNIAAYRENNRVNMKLIGLTEKEVMDFTDGLLKEVETHSSDEPLQYTRHPRIDPDSLYTMPPLPRKPGKEG